MTLYNCVGHQIIVTTNIKSLPLYWDPFYQHGLNWIPPWIGNCIHNKVWDEINHLFLNFNDYLSVLWLKLICVSKRDPWCDICISHWWMKDYKSICYQMGFYLLTYYPSICGVRWHLCMFLRENNSYFLHALMLSFVTVKIFLYSDMRNLMWHHVIKRILSLWSWYLFINMQIHLMDNSSDDKYVKPYQLGLAFMTQNMPWYQNQEYEF